MTGLGEEIADSTEQLTHIDDAAYMVALKLSETCDPVAVCEALLSASVKLFAMATVGARHEDQEEAIYAMYCDMRDMLKQCREAIWHTAN